MESWRTFKSKAESSEKSMPHGGRRRPREPAPLYEKSFAELKQYSNSGRNGKRTYNRVKYTSTAVEVPIEIDNSSDNSSSTNSGTVENQSFIQTPIITSVGRLTNFADRDQIQQQNQEFGPPPALLLIQQESNPNEKYLLQLGNGYVNNAVDEATVLNETMGSSSSLPLGSMPILNGQIQTKPTMSANFPKFNLTSAFSGGGIVAEQPKVYPSTSSRPRKKPQPIKIDFNRYTFYFSRIFPTMKCKRCIFVSNNVRKLLLHYQEHMNVAPEIAHIMLAEVEALLVDSCQQSLPQGSSPTDLEEQINSTAIYNNNYSSSSSTGPIELICRQCGKAYNRKDRFCNHYTRHMKDKPGDVVFLRDEMIEILIAAKQIYRRYKHMDPKLHDPTMVPTVRLEKLDAAVRCRVCREMTYSINSWYEHNLSHQPKRPRLDPIIPQSLPSYKCDECDYQYSTISDFAAHKITHIMNNKQTEAENLPPEMISPPKRVVLPNGVEVRQASVKCRVCSQDFTHIQDLETHMSQAHSSNLSRSYVCAKCAKTYTSFQELSTHLHNDHKMSNTVFFFTPNQHDTSSSDQVPKLIRLDPNRVEPSSGGNSFINISSASSMPSLSPNSTNPAVFTRLFDKGKQSFKIKINPGPRVDFTTPSVSVPMINAPTSTMNPVISSVRGAATPYAQGNIRLTTALTQPFPLRGVRFPRTRGPRPFTPVVSAPRSIAPVLSAPRSIAPVLSAPRSIAPVLSAPRSIAPVLSAPRSITPVASAPSGPNSPNLQNNPLLTNQLMTVNSFPKPPPVIEAPIEIDDDDDDEELLINIQNKNKNKEKPEEGKDAPKETKNAENVIEIDDDEEDNEKSAPPSEDKVEEKKDEEVVSEKINEEISEEPTGEKINEEPIGEKINEEPVGEKMDVDKIVSEGETTENNVAKVTDEGTNESQIIPDVTENSESNSEQKEEKSDDGFIKLEDLQCEKEIREKRQKQLIDLRWKFDPGYEFTDCELQIQYYSKYSMMRYKCISCDKNNLKVKDLAKHLTTVHDVKSQIFVCDFCDYTTLKSAQFASHYLERHQNVLKENRLRYPQCLACREIIKGDLKEFKNHIHLHNAKARFGCTMCSYRFFDFGRLADHCRLTHFANDVRRGNQKLDQMKALYGDEIRSLRDIPPKRMTTREIVAKDPKLQQVVRVNVKKLKFIPTEECKINVVPFASMKSKGKLAFKATRIWYTPPGEVEQPVASTESEKPEMAPTILNVTTLQKYSGVNNVNESQ